jgi:ATP-binding cassette, subfamily G (WHITE), member 2, PDR
VEEAMAKDSEKAVEDSSETDEEDRRRETEVHALARQLTSRTSYTEIRESPYDVREDSKLNPNSPHFSAKTWAKAIARTHLEDPKTGPSRTAGVAFKDLNVYGFGAATDYQKTVGNIWLESIGLARKIMGVGQRRIDILRDFEGVVHPGEMLVVLGPPGSGCSTLLKTLSGETSGFNVDDKSYINYQGISAEQMHKDFRGEAIYTAEVDVHFPMLTVADTLTFASRARAPRHVPGGVSKAVFANHLRDVIMAIFGISHTKNTCVRDSSDCRD